MRLVWMERSKAMENELLDYSKDLLDDRDIFTRGSIFPSDYQVGKGLEEVSILA
jgi:hypothetical protein